MTYTATKLITNAYYLTGIVGREFQEVSGTQLQDGLDMLNEILADKVVESDMIPYYTTQYNFESVPAQEKYFIPNLISVETLVFFINTVRFNTAEVGRDRYFGSARAENIDSLPFTWHQERVFGGCNIFLYFFPNVPYTMQLSGLFRLASVSLNQDLSNNSTSYNLGTVTVTGAGQLGPNELVVNGKDLQGTYATPAALVAYINTGVASPVLAKLEGTELFLYAPAPNTILVSTAGTQSITNNVSFSNFNTFNGPFSNTAVPQGLDQFYINYLKYALADRICKEFNFEIPIGIASQLDIYKEMISKKSAPRDMTLQTISTLGTQNSFVNWGQANLGKGWTVP